jgi:hypothetical protein
MTPREPVSEERIHIYDEHSAPRARWRFRAA